MRTVTTTRTAEDFRRFERYVDLWMRHFGLHMRWGWHVTWGEDPSVYASVTYRVTSRLAIFEYSRSIDDQREPQQPHDDWSSACHEVMHLVLAPLMDWAEQGAPRCLNLIDLEHEVMHGLIANALVAYPCPDVSRPKEVITIKGVGNFQKQRAGKTTSK